MSVYAAFTTKPGVFLIFYCDNYSVVLVGSTGNSLYVTKSYYVRVNDI